MLSRRSARLALAAAVTLLATVAGLVVSGPAFSHGYTMAPTSRAKFCQQGTVTDCGDIQWEPQSVEGPKGFPNAGPPDGEICSGSVDRFSELDDPRGGNWPTNDLTSGASYTFHWYLTARHATTDFEYYVTNSSYDPTQPLTRSELNLTPFLVVPGNGRQPPNNDVYQTGPLPDVHGRAMILAVWVIADTGNAFYQCSDINFS